MHTTMPRKLALGAVALLGIGSATGLGLARYAESDAFAFYKQPRPDFSRPFATPVTISTGPRVAAPTETLFAAPSVAPQSYLTEASVSAPIVESEPAPAPAVEEDADAVRVLRNHPDVQPAAAWDAGSEAAPDATEDAATPDDSTAGVEDDGQASEAGQEASSAAP